MCRIRVVKSSDTPAGPILCRSRASNQIGTRGTSRVDCFSFPWQELCGRFHGFHKLGFGSFISDGHVVL